MASAVSIGSGFRGGLFFASLLLGAVLGKLFAVLVASVAIPAVDPMLLATVGMSAFGAAVIGAPLAMTFLAFETTRDFAVAGTVLMAVTNAVDRGTAALRLLVCDLALPPAGRDDPQRSRHRLAARPDGGQADAAQPVHGTRRHAPLRLPPRISARLREARCGRVDEADRYAGLVPVPEAHLEIPGAERVADLLQATDQVLLPAMNAKEAMAVFDVNGS